VPINVTDFELLVVASELVTPVVLSHGTILSTGRDEEAEALFQQSLRNFGSPGVYTG
jgi:hypothetical protein